MSSQPVNPLYGRKYELQILMPPDSTGTQREVLTVSSSDFGNAALRFTFDCQMWRYHTNWMADISIYNLNELTTDKLLNNAGLAWRQPSTLIKQNMEVVISAGYANGNYGVIWRGPIFQWSWERVDVTDFKLTLDCNLALYGFGTDALVSQTFAAGAQQLDVIRAIAAQAFKGTPVFISPNISEKRLPRAKTLFGSPSKYLTQIAQDNGMSWWLSKKGLGMGKAAEPGTPLDPAIVFTPTTGIIGTPQQTVEGVTLTVLLDPRVECKQPTQQIKIDNSSIRARKIQIGETKFLPLDQDGIYHVIGVRHYGDNRGDDWYTEITGVSDAWYKALDQPSGQLLASQ
jgi:hypothetical protein